MAFISSSCSIVSMYQRENPGIQSSYTAQNTKVCGQHLKPILHPRVLKLQLKQLLCIMKDLKCAHLVKETFVIPGTNCGKQA